jgi:beta-glucosidase
VESFYAGIEGGEAIACALYGEHGCNRWGKLPVTVFPATFAKNDMANMGVSTGGSGMRTYKYYTNEFGAPLYPFGHGLSYTPFTVAWANPPSTAAAPPAAPGAESTAPAEHQQNSSVSVVVRNTGSREGDEVLMLYWVGGASGSNVTVPAGTPVPNLKLVGYRRLSLDAGANATVTFAVTAEQLALVDGNGDTQLFKGTHRLRVTHGQPPADGHGQSGPAASLDGPLERDFSVGATTMLRRLEW